MTRIELVRLRAEIEQLGTRATRTPDDPVEVVCELSDGAPATEVRAAFPDDVLPADVRDWWSLSRDTHLFRDVEYSQWGLHILSPAAARDASQTARRDNPQNVYVSDVVIGTFLGDGELLLVSSRDGTARIALEMDPRDDWPVFDDLTAFLRRWVETRGDKFWPG